MSGVTKSYQSANTPVLKNIYLSFFYGAKIGILGLNGSGKSTLLKIIAGVDKNYQGDVVFSQDYSVGEKIIFLSSLIIHVLLKH
jgi:energy-dependent translational throttle protein EttA